MKSIGRVESYGDATGGFVSSNEIPDSLIEAILSLIPTDSRPTVQEVRDIGPPSAPLVRDAANLKMIPQGAWVKYLKADGETELPSGYDLAAVGLNDDGAAGIWVTVGRVHSPTADRKVEAESPAKCSFCR